MSTPNTVQLWSGLSLLDKAPTILLLSGLRVPSKNVKTGNMLQTYILRADISPLEAIQTGADASICGDCGHRGIINGHKNTQRRSRYPVESTLDSLS